MSLTRPSDQVPVLTGFRALAAAMVFFGHAVDRRALGPLWPITYGWTGVNLFFALSGFLFTRLYFDRFAAGAVSLRTYFLKRAFRVLPLTWFLVFASYAAHPHYSAADVLTHLTLTQVYFAEYRFSINPPMWTLCVEESFYLLVPPLFVALGAVERARLAASVGRRLLVTLIALAAFSQACTGVALNLQLVDHALSGEWKDFYWVMTVFGRFGDFGFGIAAGLVALRAPDSRALRSRLGATLTLAAGVALWACASVWMQSRGGVNAAGSHALFHVVSKLHGAGGALMILGLYNGAPGAGILSTRAAVYAGKISFALYLLQYARLDARDTVTDVVARAVRGVIHREALAALAIYLLVSAVAAALHHLVEEPARKRLGARFIAAA